MVGKFTKPVNVKALEEISCPNCQGTITVRASGQSKLVVCSYCSSFIDLKDPSGNLILLSHAIKGPKSKNPTPILSLGARGKLHGTQWEVIGFVVRKAKKKYIHEEYLLYNPYKGFRWLTQEDGHWNYVVSLHELPKIVRGRFRLFSQKYGATYATYLDKTYRLFHKVRSKTTYIQGEFYWDIKPGDTTNVTEYIKSPFILSLEETVSKSSPRDKKQKDKEIIWSLGEYVEAKNLSESFSIPLERFPVKKGIAPNQPCPHISRNKLLYPIAVFFLSVLVMSYMALHLLTNEEKIVDMKKPLLSTWWTLKKQEEWKAKIVGKAELSTLDTLFVTDFMTSDFKIPPSLGVLKIAIDAPISNTWLEVDMDLVNKETGEAVSISSGIEFYSGRDNGEDWSEGDRQKTETIRNIPPGTYYLDVKVTGNNYDLSKQRNIVDLNIQITQGHITSLEFLIALFGILIFPFLNLVLSYFFDEKRWSESEYSPYMKDND